MTQLEKSWRHSLFRAQVGNHERATKGIPPTLRELRLMWKGATKSVANRWGGR